MILLLFFILNSSGITSTGMPSSGDHSSVDLPYIDSLFVRATVGRFDYLDLNQPARDTFVILSQSELFIDDSISSNDSICNYLVNKLSIASSRQFIAIVDIFTKIGKPCYNILLNNLQLKDIETQLSIIYIAGKIKDTLLSDSLISLYSEDTYNTCIYNIFKDSTFWRVKANISRILDIDEKYIPIILENLNDSHPKVRLYSLISFLNLKIIDNSFLPYIIPLLSDENIDIRSTASVIISSMQKPNISDEINFKNSFELIHAISFNSASLDFLISISDTSDLITKIYIYNEMSNTTEGIEYLNFLLQFNKDNAIIINSLNRIIKNE